MQGVRPRAGTKQISILLGRELLGKKKKKRNVTRERERQRIIRHNRKIERDKEFNRRVSEQINKVYAEIAIKADKSAEDHMTIMLPKISELKSVILSAAEELDSILDQEDMISGIESSPLKIMLNRVIEERAHTTKRCFHRNYHQKLQKELGEDISEIIRREVDELLPSVDDSYWVFVDAK